MEEFNRAYPRLSACGLNCGLCPRFHTEGDSRCPGCGGEAFLTKRPACGVLSCCRRHGGIEYCYLCGEYPCKKYEGAALVDSFITHRNMRRDFEKAKRQGLKAYRAELDEKVEILQNLLAHYNDGRRKSFFCLAVNLLELPDLKQVMERLMDDTDSAEGTTKERAKQAEKLLREMADSREIPLRLDQKK